MKKFSVIIIGAGGQGALADAPGSQNENKIISFAHALKIHPGFNLLGFIDKDIDKAKKATETWGATYYDSHLENYAPEINLGNCIAVIATPDSTHYDILKQLAEYPLKLVICEKPLCTNLEQAREIVKLYKQKNIPLMVNHTRNFLPYYQEFKKRYKDGEFGKIISANVVFNRGWEHTATHAISFLEWFFEGQYNGKIIECKTDYRIWQIDLYFEKHHWREERIGNMPVWSYYDDAMWHIVDNAYNFLEGKEPLKCTSEDALRTLEICFELMEGAKV